MSTIMAVLVLVSEEFINPTQLWLCGLVGRRITTVLCELNWCFTITFVDNSISFCCYFTVKLLLHHLLPPYFYIHKLLLEKFCTCHMPCLGNTDKNSCDLYFLKINKLSYCRRKRRKENHFMYT